MTTERNALTEVRISNQYSNGKNTTAKRYDLVRCAGSVGANYIEANESLGKKDFLMHIKISRKEAKESRYWLYLAGCNKEAEGGKEKLIQESTELMKIFGSIIAKSA